MSPVQGAVGERLGALRRRRGLTQEGLAEAAGVAVSTVRKLEQGTRHTARMPTLAALASGVGVPLSALLSTQQAGATLRDGEPLALAPIRRALTPGSAGELEGDGASLEQVRESVRLGWGLYQDGDYETLAAVAPDLIVEAGGAAREHGAGGQAVLAEAHHVTASLLMALSAEDLAYIAVLRLMDAADQAGDPLLAAAGEDTRAWIFSRHGRLNDAAHTAIQAGEAIEPRLGQASQAHVAVWAGLVLRAVMVTSRNEQQAETADLLNLAETAAHRVGSRNDHWTVISPANIAMHRARVALELGNPQRALELAQVVPRSRVEPPVWRARHLIDVAQAQTVTRRDADAVATLKEIERVAPGWLRYQGLAESLVRELLARERRSATPGLRGFAEMLGIPN